MTVVTDIRIERHYEGRGQRDQIEHHKGWLKVEYHHVDGRHGRLPGRVILTDASDNAVVASVDARDLFKALRLAGCPL